MKHLALGLLCVLPITGFTSEPNIKLNSESDKISYSIGYQVGGDLKRQGVSPNAEALLTGMKNAISNHETLLSDEEMRTTLINFKKKILADKEKLRQEEKLKTQKEGKIFLADNAKDKQVVSLSSGLQYKVINTGTGKSPKPNDKVTVHYVGKLINGNEFDSSTRNNTPATFIVESVIKGWTEALQLMKEGDKWELFIPPELGYGDQGPLANQTLVFEVELLSVITL